jgi:hypothetical protein
MLFGGQTHREVPRKGFIGLLSPLDTKREVVIYRFVKRLAQLINGRSLEGHHVVDIDDFTVKNASVIIELN